MMQGWDNGSGMRRGDGGMGMAVYGRGPVGGAHGTKKGETSNEEHPWARRCDNR